MENEEAIKYLKQIYPNGGHCWLDEQRIEAIGMAIQALQKEPVIKVWHDANEEQPEEYRTVVVWNPITMDGEILTRCVEVYKGRIWAYIEDLLKLSNVEITFKLNK